MTFSFSKTAIAATLLTGLLAAPMLHAQGRDWDRFDKNGRYDDHTRLTQIDAGAYITVRTQQAIDTNRANGGFFPAIVQDDVWDQYRRLSVPAIQRGSQAQLSVRTAGDGDLILDLDSLSVGGQRYSVSTTNERIDSGNPRLDNNAAERVAGGAIIGSIIGAIAGGGKGAAVGGVAGAAVGVGLSTHGRNVRVPAGSVLTFRLDRPLSIAVKAPVRR